MKYNLDKKSIRKTTLITYAMILFIFLLNSYIIINMGGESIYLTTSLFLTLTILIFIQHFINIFINEIQRLQKQINMLENRT